MQQTMLNKSSCYESIVEEQVRCAVCGSEFVVHYEDYSVLFYLFHVRCTKELAKPIGAIATKPFPLVFGLYSLQREVLGKIDLFEPAGFDEAGIERFTRYMMALSG